MSTPTTYPGGKNGSGVYQQIINQIPPHSLYIEPFLGSGAIFRMKRPALYSILIDLDASVLGSNSLGHTQAVEYHHMDALHFLDYYSQTKDIDNHTTFIYCDPPYLHSTRTRPNQYTYELTDADHERLLHILTQYTSANIAISGYYSDLYAEKLSTWRLVTFPAKTRGNTMATEHLWMNYPEPIHLHDYAYLGANYRERERITRKKKRWTEKLTNLPTLERYAILSAINDLFPSPVSVAAKKKDECNHDR